MIALSTKLSRIKSGIKSRLILVIKYHGIKRTVECHILGYNFEKKPIIRVFELIRDEVETNVFKIYLISDIQSLTVTKNKFTRQVTKPTDAAMSKVVLTTYNDKEKEEESN